MDKLDALCILSGALVYLRERSFRFPARWVDLDDAGAYTRLTMCLALLVADYLHGSEGICA